MMILGLMAKPMVVTLPFALLLLDVWPLERRGLGWQRLIAEKLPLLALSAAASLVTLRYQRTSLAPLDLVPWSLRLANAAVSYAAYLGKLLLPRNLAVFYPIPLAIPAWQVAAAAALLAALTALAVWKARRAPWLLVGWLWFLGTLVPVIGLVQVGRQAMADRYTYHPLDRAVRGASSGESPRWRADAGRVIVAAAAAVIALLAMGTWMQTGYLAGQRHPVSPCPGGDARQLRGPRRPGQGAGGETGLGGRGRAVPGRARPAARPERGPGRAGGGSESRKSQSRDLRDSRDNRAEIELP